MVHRLISYNGIVELRIQESSSNELIAVEAKSFVAASAISEFHTALGQFLNYRVALKLKDPSRILYLAIPVAVYQDFFSRQLPQLSVKEYQLKLLVFDPETEEIVQWRN